MRRSLRCGLAADRIEPATTRHHAKSFMIPASISRLRDPRLRLLSGRTLTAILTFAAAALLVPAALAGGNSDEPGALASDGRWYTTGGCAARTSNSDAAPTLDRPARAWSRAFAGEIEEEPLVWDDHVFLSCKRDATTRALHVLSLRTGRPLCPPRIFPTPVPLSPTVWNGRVLVRSAPSELTAFAVAGGALSSTWRRPADFVYGPPLWFEDEIYVVDGDTLLRLATDRERPVWDQMGVYRGRPSLRGTQVYITRFGRGAPWIESLSRSSGRRDRLFELTQPLEIPPEHTDIRLTVLDDHVAVHTPPFDERSADMFSRRVCIGPRRSLPEYEIRAYRLAGEIAALGPGWIGYLDDPSAGRFLGSPEPGKGNEFSMYATGRVHPEFLYPARSVSLARGVAYVGHRAFEPESGRIHWMTDRPARFRAIPLRRSLLLVDAANRLSYLRPRRLDDSVAIWPTAPASSSTGPVRHESATVVLRDGSTRTATVTIDPHDTPPRFSGDSLNGDDIAYVETANRRPLYAASERDLLHAVLDLAAADADAAIDATADRRRAPTRSPKRAGAGAVVTEQVFLRAANLPPDGRDRALLVLLREVLERDPAHERAHRTVRALLPAGIAAPRPFDALDVLEFIEIRRTMPVEVFVKTEPTAGTRTPADTVARDIGGQREFPRELAAARAGWRPDLVGYRSPQLLVITPVAQRPGAIARCLSLGELVCDTLGDIFGLESHESDSDPLTLRLYESQSEYIERAAGKSANARGEGIGLGLEWTAGFYAASTNRSHIFLPAGATGFDQVGETYAHELTHHWLQQNIHRLGDGRGKRTVASRRDPDGRGYWIVEGFATFIQEQPFDLERRRIDDTDPGHGATSLAFVADSDAELLLPWEAVTHAPWRLYAGLSLEETDEIEAAGHLGRVRPMSQMRAFYLQSAAICHYLYRADDGRRRGALLEYLRRFYTGGIDAGDFEEIFGATSLEIGRATETFARGIASKRR